jgi:hypothetical protein
LSISIKYPFSIAMVILIGLVGLLLERRLSKLKAAGGNLPTLRKLPAIDAIEEVIGRATEMNRPIHVPFDNYSTFGSTDAASTMAGLEFWEYECKLAARYGARIFCTDAGGADILPVLYDKCKQAYLTEGKIDEYDPEYAIRFITGMKGPEVYIPSAMVVREKVAAQIMISPTGPLNVFMITEAGMRVGAVNIMGMTTTNSYCYLPVWGDYILIGEEVFAASAYITKDPIAICRVQTGDIFRAIFIAIIVLGAVLAAVGVTIMRTILS